MIRRLEDSHDNVIGYSIADEVTDEEYAQAASELRDDIAVHGRIRLLFRLRGVSLSSFLGVLDDEFRFVKEHKDEIERVALVTDDTAAEMLAKVTDAVGPVETQTFGPDDEPRAWAWLE